MNKLSYKLVCTALSVVPVTCVITASEMGFGAGEATYSWVSAALSLSYSTASMAKYWGGNSTALYRQVLLQKPLGVTCMTSTRRG